MEDYIIFASIFVCTFVIVCILYDCILRSRMEKRLRETWGFINRINAEPDVPERLPF